MKYLIEQSKSLSSLYGKKELWQPNIDPYLMFTSYRHFLIKYSSIGIRVFTIHRTAFYFDTILFLLK